MLVSVVIALALMSLAACSHVPPGSAPVLAPTPSAIPVPTATPAPLPTAAWNSLANARWLDQIDPALASDIKSMYWVADGLDEVEAHILQELLYIAILSRPAVSNIVQMDWVQDGVDGQEFEAIKWVDNSGDAEIALSVTRLAWMRDGIEELEARAIEALSYIGQKDSSLAAAVMALPWFQDGVGRQEVSAIEELLLLSHKDVVEASSIVAMPFLETLEPPDVSALKSLAHMMQFSPGEYQRVISHPTLASGITDDWTRAVAFLYDVTGANPDLADALLDPAQIALASEVQRRWPSARQPVSRVDAAAQLASALFVIEHAFTPPQSVRAHPASEDFPGPVPADAPRIRRSLTIDTAIPLWHSTGLYAAPGELITVTVPAKLAQADSFGVRVGAHTDRIWQRSEWTRMPDISRYFPIFTTRTVVANAFGGLIYIDVPDDADIGSVTIEIEGAVAAPLFVLGETDLADWRNEIRHAQAPWAEIAGRNMIVTTDARNVRGLDDPALVAETWDRVLDLNAELAAWPSPARPYPERFVVDRQISVGYMHNGYPIMAHMDQQANLVNAEHLGSECNWGFYHEVGHNHQAPDWTFDGTVEVTVNLFTLYVYEFLCGIPVDGERFHGSHQSWSELMALYDFDNPDFQLWKREPFLALIMYAQIQKEFGWDAYRQVFATYRALPDAERPRSDDEKRDQWLVRLSRQVGRDLGPFFEAWGVPTSQAARDSIADLQVWMPANFPPGRYVSVAGEDLWVGPR